jgi:peroxiredoxin
MMKRMTWTILALSFLIIAVGCSSTESSDKKETKTGHAAHADEAMAVAMVGKTAPDFTLIDAQGEAHTLSDYRSKYVVLEWINFDCPFVKKHYNSGNIPSLQETYREKGVVWLSICSSAPGKQGHFEGDELLSHIDASGSNASAYLIDESGKVGRMYDAKTTPNMFVINPEGTLLYAGAIDDKATTKLEDIETANNYVTLALNAAMNDKEIATKTSQPYGCSVKYQ